MRAPAWSARRWSADLRAILGLSLLAALLFGGALRGRTFATGDLQLVFLGQLDSFVASVAHGAWPVWDPLFGFGQPLWANPGNQVLYPATWLNLLVLPETYLTLYVVGHALWAAVGVWVLGSRQLGLSGWAAWLAAAGWMACGPMLSLVQRWQHFASAAWLPWVVSAALWGVERPSKRATLALAAALSLQWLSGSLEIAVATALIALGWSFASARRDGLRVARAWILAGPVAIGLTAAMWIPALDLLQRSGRAELVGSSRFFWSIHPWRWLELLAPLRPDEMLLRPELRAELLGATGTTIVPSLYLGAAMGCFVSWGLLLSPRRALTRGLAALAGACAVAAMWPHVPALAWVEQRLPVASILRYPGKLSVFVAFAWALLAALGLDAWRARLVSSRNRARVWIGAAACLPALCFVLAAGVFPGLLAGRLVPTPPPGARVWDAVSLDAVFCAAATGAVALCLALAWLASRHPRFAPACAAAMALVAAADLALPNHRVNLTVRRELVGRPPETAFRLKADGATRVHVLENEPLPRGPAEPTPPRRLDLDPAAPLGPQEAMALGANIALAGRSATRWGLAGSFTLESLVAPTREQLALSRRFYSMVDQPAALALLQAGAVTHVVARLVTPEGLGLLGTVPSPLLAPVRILRVPSPLPGTYVVGRAVTGSDEEALSFLLDPRADRARTVVLSDGPPGAGPPGFSGTSRVAERRPDALRVEVEASSDGMLVLVEAYDPGWTATVDGRPAPVHRANLGFRAVPVPAGRHSVRLLYRPRAVSVGLLISAATLAGVLMVVGHAWARRGSLSRALPG